MGRMLRGSDMVGGLLIGLDIGIKLVLGASVVIGHRTYC